MAGREGLMKGKETLHQKTGGREDSDGSSRTASLEVVDLLWCSDAPP